MPCCPEARQELAKLHGRGLFAKKGEGVAVDELADMLKNEGWLEQDTDSSTLVEMLKCKKRPKARKAGKTPALRQNVAANSLGVPMERVTVFDRALSRKEMDEALAALAGQNLENKLEGLYAQVNLVQRKKLRSAKAIDKSIDNGFGGASTCLLRQRSKTFGPGRHVPRLTKMRLSSVLLRQSE